MRCHLKQTRWGLGLFFFLFASLTTAELGARQETLNIIGGVFQVDRLDLRAGDQLKICNQDSYRRQPYLRGAFNDMGRRTSDILEWVRKGECRDFTLKNPTDHFLKVTVHDAIASKAKLHLRVFPETH